MMNHPIIKEAIAWPVNIELKDNFSISNATIVRADNAYARVVLSDGNAGYGEFAPFEEITGETRADGLQIMKKLCALTEGKDISGYKNILNLLNGASGGSTGPLCALETALLDAWCRYKKMPLWSLWTKKPRKDLSTDITIPIHSFDKSMELAGYWDSKGFSTLKMKVGINPDEEIRLISSINRKYPRFSFIVDANQGFDVPTAISFINELYNLGANIRLFEQPNDRFDLEGMAEIKSKTRVPVAADEAVTTAAHAKEIVRLDAADILNLKIMKSGVMETLEIIKVATDAGKDLMIGGMVESRIAMGCSFALAQSFSGIRFLDLDTPILMKDDPVKGGYFYEGENIITTEDPGLGVTPGKDWLPG